MEKMFGLDSKLMQFLTKIADLIILNFLYLIGCIPLVTIGTSTVALYYCVEKYRLNDGVALFKTFWGAYRSNFKQATALWGVLLLVISVLIADFVFLYRVDFEINEVLLLAALIIALLTIIAMGYVFPLQAGFVNTVSQTLKNAWFMSIANLPRSIVVASVNLLPFVLFLLWPDIWERSVIVWLFVGASGIAYTNNLVLQKVFRRYYDQEEQTKSTG